MLATTSESMPRFIATLAAPIAPADELVRVPLAVTGRWARGTREFAITREDLESIARNFTRRQNGEINVDYDHASEMPEVGAGGPIPSAGRIVKLDPPEEFGNGSRESEVGSREKPETRVPSREPRFILWGWYEPTERARRLIANREYRYISPAIDWAARSKSSGKPQGATLSTVALTNRPFLEEMPPIRLSDPEYRLVEHQVSDLETDIPFSATSHPISGGTMNKVELSVEGGGLRTNQKGQNTSGNPSSVETPTSGEAIPLARAGAFLSEADAAGKSVSALEIFHGEVDREIEDAVRTGKILPRRRDDWRRIALADLPAFRRIVADQKPQVPLRPVGFSGAAPEGAHLQVKLLAEQRMRERGVSFGQALSEISREQPELAREYRRAVSSSE